MTTTEADTGTVNRLVRYLPMIVLVVLVAAGAGAAAVTRGVIHDQQDRLLRQRTDELTSQLQSSNNGEASSYRIIGGVYVIERDNPIAFDAIASSIVKKRVISLGVAKLEDGRIVVPKSVTTAAAPNNLSGSRLEAVTRSLSEQGLASAVVTDQYGRRSLFRSTAGPLDTAVFIESEIDPAMPTKSSSLPKDIEAAVYASPTTDPTKLVATTEGAEVVGEGRIVRQFDVGVDTWTIVVAPKGSMIGTLAPKVPWIILVAAFAGALLATAVAEVLVRRRVYAMRLVDDRTAELRAAHDELELAHQSADAANRSKSEFLSRMSHELRTPLNAVLGFAQLLEQDDLRDDQRDAVNHIVKGGKHLLDLINEVLDISRIETGNLAISLEPVLVSELYDEVVSLVAQLAKENGIRIDRPASAELSWYVEADRQRLKQVMLNLLSNAIKYNRGNGVVTVSASTPDEGRLRLSVTDTCPGIRAEQHAMLFTPFERLGAEQTGVEGTGIGLALSLRLADAMGGDLDFESVPGKGSTFWIDLSRSEGPLERLDRLETPGAAATTSSPDGASRSILYVEDNVANLLLVERVFAQRDDLTILTATQGNVGIEIARGQRPDVILLDVHLPDIDGDEVLAALRADASTASIPVVMVTADATSSTARRLLDLGAVTVITKPIDVAALVAKVDELLSVTAAAPPA